MSSDEVSRFVEMNKHLRPGEWVWDVVDEHVEAREASAIIEPGLEPEKQQFQREVIVTSQRSTSNVKDQSRSGAHVDRSCSWSGPINLLDPHLVPEPEFACHQDSLPEAHANTINHLMGLFDTGSPSPVSPPPSPSDSVQMLRIDPSWTERPSPQASRCKFPPRLPPRRKTKDENEVTKWVPQNVTVSKTVAVTQKDPSQCGHRRQSKSEDAGHCWICTDCGEELWFDGWRLEWNSK